MIETRTTGAHTLSHRLADRAKSLAVAVGTSRLLARRADPARWRKARLLWPLFAKD